MTDRVVVTVLYMDHEQVLFQDDFELSANVPISEMKEGILKALKKEKRDLFQSVDTIDIAKKETSNHILGDEVTLASEGIWDGSILVIRRHV